MESATEYDHAALTGDRRRFSPSKMSALWRLESNYPHRHHVMICATTGLARYKAAILFQNQNWLDDKKLAEFIKIKMDDHEAIVAELERNAAEEMEERMDDDEMVRSGGRGGDGDENGGGQDCGQEEDMDMNRFPGGGPGGPGGPGLLGPGGGGFGGPCGMGGPPGPWGRGGFSPRGPGPRFVAF